MSGKKSGKIPKILIIGAGPTGLTAGLELARRGIIPDIIDIKDGPSPLSRAVGILPSSMDILEPSGVAQRIRLKAISVERMKVHQEGVLKASLPIDILPDPQMRIFAMPQDKTEKLITERFEQLGGKVHYSAALEGLSQNNTGVTALINGRRRKFDYVIGADGIRSKTRDLLGLSYNGYELAGDWSIADFETSSDFGAKQFNVFFLPEGQIAIIVPLLHIGGSFRYRAVSSRPDALRALPIEIESPKVKRAANFKIRIAQVETYQKGRVFLAGDAAHCHSPVGGRGMNLGIADAADLARRFHEGGLDRYHDARHIVGRKTIERTEAARKFLMSKSWWKRRFFIGLINLAPHIPPLHRAILRDILTG